MTAPWKALLQQALASNTSPTSQWPTLATITHDYKPRVRTIVFRGFIGDTTTSSDTDRVRWEDMLVFTTDARSAKVREIVANGSGELCWYFPETREQFRLAGTVRVVLPPHHTMRIHEADMPNSGIDWEELRKHHFHNLSPGARSQFLWPNPKQTRADTSGWVQAINDQDTQAISEALKNFSLLVFEVQGIDRLELREHPNRRMIMEKEGESWRVTEINP
ncbi:uncharacterized protein SPPG_07132 [Spizellomyces punctatus DAOM BR117]|uniref:Pyridoxamine 5'-phosphate oxidase Alr4036 family FMN-binding domain-containing protein n=1 Tax=Spizellomyces punctatus (strain DAOM BR117) TaxID=645134 RepID=A0A0L0H813_SPIPD|nr:uncharacterized protein SPPG_07132 [Spizellomyces punctatus DAOM BR117]KNC97665.1 hypothetical protein SPPG_07132 [Spizellomyces punctatus DAOM BR117]|eukprot:XP_016605705.1 hypothetical protein SPPG_07132 [Spizellomyces punctatus DAOM BR117]